LYKEKKRRRKAEAGLIERELTSKEDEPILAWKSHISFPKSSIIRRFIEKLTHDPLGKMKNKRLSPKIQ